MNIHGQMRARFNLLLARSRAGALRPGRWWARFGGLSIRRQRHRRKVLQKADEEERGFVVGELDKGDRQSYLILLSWSTVPVDRDRFEDQR